MMEIVHKHGENGGKLCNKIYIGTCDEAGLSPVEDPTVEVSPFEMPGVKKYLWRNWGLVAAVTVLSFWVLHSTSYAEAFSLWALSPEYYGGLEFTTSQVADVLAVSGGGILIFQLLVFPLIANFVGPIQLIRVSAVLTTIMMATYPLFHRLHGKPLWALLILASVVQNILSTVTFTGAYILINNSVEKEQRGVANGVSTSFMSGFQAVGPTLAGAIFSWSEERMGAFLPGMWMVFSLLGVLSFFPFLATLQIFLPPSLNNPIEER